MTASTIGFLKRKGDKFDGYLATLSINADITMVKNGGKSQPDQPDYRVFCTDNKFELGAGWIRTSKTSGNDYISLALTAPEFPVKVLYANLGQAPNQDDPDNFALIWNPDSSN